MHIEAWSFPDFGPDGFPEHRSKEQLEIDRAHVRRQLRVLDPAAQTDRVEKIIDQIQARQDQAPVQHALPFDRFPVTDSSGRQIYVLVARGQLVVRVDPADKPAVDPRQMLREMGYRRDERIPRPRDPRTEVYEADRRPEELARDIRKLAGVGIKASPNLVVPLGHIIKGEDYPSATAGPGPFPTETSGPPGTDVRVAVIDTGITPEDRTDSWLDSIRREPGNTDPIDVLPDDGLGGGDGRLDWWAGHGSFAAGIVQRVAPGCGIVAYRFTRSDGLGTEKEVAEAMLSAAEEGRADGVRLIINASLGTPGIGGAPPLALRDAVELIKAEFPDVLIVASAGNAGTTEPIYPAALDGVVAVGALTDDLQPAPFSSHGAWVDCSCVGVGVVSTFVPGILPPVPDPSVPDFEFGADSWAVWTGTSFSAPQISGLVARACLHDAGLAPHDALGVVLAGLPSLPGYGSVLRVLTGTPV